MIYYSTVLAVPVEVLLKIDSIRRAFLWAASDKVTGGKCKVNWTTVCKPKEYGGLGILNLTKFAAALRLRWLWAQWGEDPKPWMMLGTPCTQDDHDLFAAATVVTIGNGEKACFWDSAWLHGRRPKDIAPLILGLSRKKKDSVRQVWIIMHGSRKSTLMMGSPWTISLNSSTFGKWSMEFNSTKR